MNFKNKDINEVPALAVINSDKDSLTIFIALVIKPLNKQLFPLNSLPINVFVKFIYYYKCH